MDASVIITVSVSGLALAEQSLTEYHSVICIGLQMALFLFPAFFGHKPAVFGLPAFVIYPGGRTPLKKERSILLCENHVRTVISKHLGPMQ